MTEEKELTVGSLLEDLLADWPEEEYEALSPEDQVDYIAGCVKFFLAKEEAGEKAPWSIIKNWLIDKELKARAKIAFRDRKPPSNLIVPQPDKFTIKTEETDG